MDRRELLMGIPLLIAGTPEPVSGSWIRRADMPVARSEHRPRRLTARFTSQAVSEPVRGRIGTTRPPISGSDWRICRRRPIIPGSPCSTGE